MYVFNLCCSQLVAYAKIKYKGLFNCNVATSQLVAMLLFKEGLGSIVERSDERRCMKSKFKD